MNLYFFYKNESTRSWYDCTIEAWEENDNTYRDGKAISSFSLLERLHIHVSKNPDYFHCGRFTHELGIDMAHGHNAKNPQDFVDEQTEALYSHMTKITHHDFQRLKKILIQLFLKYPGINFTERLLTDAPPCRLLF